MIIGALSLSLSSLYLVFLLSFFVKFGPQRDPFLPKDLNRLLRFDGVVVNKPSMPAFRFLSVLMLGALCFFLSLLRFRTSAVSSYRIAQTFSSVLNLFSERILFVYDCILTISAYFMCFCRNIYRFVGYI